MRCATRSPIRSTSKSSAVATPSESGWWKCSPGSPVPRRHRDAFVQVAAAPFADSAALVARALLLEPVFRVKWCCIILNEFIAEAADRRRFANPGTDPEASKLRQLEKARRLSNNLDF